MFDFLKKQFIDVIEWLETEDGILAYRYPMADQEIQNGAKLTVRESQMAVFVQNGQVADSFKAGLYTLNTQNLPLLTDLMNWDKMFQSPFKSDVYFFSTRQQLDQRWGTQAPVTIRDKDFGVIRVRANGIYSYQLEDPKLFYKNISGSRDVYRVDELEAHLRATILTSLGTLFGTADVAFIDMAANQNTFSDLLKQKLSPAFKEFGLNLSTFFVQSISLPEELESHLDKATSMKMVGDLRKYAQFQTAESLPLAAQNEGGIAGAGAGLGAGVAMGQAMASAFSGTVASGAGATAGSEEDHFATLNKLHDLLTKGIITQEEFDAKKAEVLRKIT